MPNAAPDTSLSIYHWANGEACSLIKTPGTIKSMQPFFHTLNTEFMDDFFLFHGVGCRPQKESSTLSFQKSVSSSFQWSQCEGKLWLKFQSKKNFDYQNCRMGKLSHLNMLLVAARTIWNLTAFLVSDCWQKRGILINLAHKKPPASSGVQRIVLFLVVKPQFIERFFHACFSLGENLLFCKSTFKIFGLTHP